MPAGTRVRGWCVAAAVLSLMAGICAAQSVQGSAQAARLSFMGRMVSNLDASVAFYQALGFVRAADEPGRWHTDESFNALIGVHGAQLRSAHLVMNSGLSGRPFSLYLHELRGVTRRDVSDHVAWEPGSSHFGLVVPDSDALWQRLREQGLLRPRSWQGQLVLPPGQSRGGLAYLTDPDGLDIEIINEYVPEPGASRPAAPARLAGVNHLGLIILDSDRARAFYSGVLGGAGGNAGSPWMQTDFTDAAIGGHGNILRFFNLAFAEALAPGVSMNFELVEFQNRKKPVEPMGIADIGVGFMGVEVDDVDRVLEEARRAGAIQVSGSATIRLSGGRRAALLRDPDVGGFVEILQRGASPPATH